VRACACGGLGGLGRWGPRAGSRREGGWKAVHVRVTVLRCAVAGADGGGGLRWLQPMVEAVCMLVWAPCRALVWVVVVCRQ
jgi:hypothetical protein